MELPLATLALQGGPSGLVAMFVALMAFGRLIPRSTHRERIDEHLARIADLKAAIAAQSETIAERDKQIGILLGLREHSSP